jgi:putative component of toxin-antitoxin plasmid stabilization module
LKDRASRARIQVRVDRLAHGNPGQHRNLSDGVSEQDIKAAIALAKNL